MKKFIRLIGVLLTLLTIPTEALAALALDCNGGTCPTATSTNSVTYSSANANITVCAVWGRVNGGTTVTAVSDTAGLTWTQRATKDSVTGSVRIDLWCAFSSGQLTSDVITGTCASCTNRTSAFGISGADTSSQYDANAAIPCKNKANSTTSVACTISTNTANDFLIAIYRGDGAPGTITPPTGFSQIMSTGTNQYMAYNIVSSTQSSVAETYASTGTVNSSEIIDAVICTGCAGGGGGGTPGSGSAGFLWGTGF